MCFIIAMILVLYLFLYDEGLFAISIGNLVERLTSESLNLQVSKTRLYNPYEGHKS